MHRFRSVLCLLIVSFFCFAQLASAAVEKEYVALGDDKNGFYKEMIGLDQAEGTRLQLTRHPRYVSAMGMMIETNPWFSITGKFANNAVELKVEPEDILVKIGGINAVVRVDYHVSGKIGANEIKLTIKDDHPVTKLDENINVQTGFRKVIEGLDLVFEQITEIAEVSGINVVSGRYHQLTSVKNKNVSLKITEFSDSSFKITGETTDLALAVLVSLRPFLL